MATDLRSGGARRGRPPGTSVRDLEVISLRLFTELGFEDTTVERIAAAAGVSRRTFFRYFDSKADVLWHAFDGEVRALRAAFADIPADVPVMAAIRRAVVGVNRYRADDVPELRIIEQDLWDRIKARQKAIKVERSTGKPNRLHERQRAKYLFSGLT